ncbi:APC family permease, partial [Streptomyces sp. SID3343]|nr:APC family permease [Streptomyces sp. SID3343]
AGGVQIAVAAVVIGAFALAGADPLLTLSTSTVGLATLALLLLQTAVAVSVIVFFHKRGHRSPSLYVFSGLGAAGLATVTGLATTNYSTLTGSDSTAVNSLPWALPAVIVLGVAYALVLRRHRPAIYAAIAASDTKPAAPEPAVRETAA